MWVVWIAIVLLVVALLLAMVWLAREITMVENKVDRLALRIAQTGERYNHVNAELNEWRNWWEQWQGEHY